MTEHSDADPTERYFTLLMAGDLKGFLGLFAGRPLVDDPRTGPVEGEEPIEYFVEAHQDWLARRHARVELLRVTRGAERSVAEYVLHQVIRDHLVSVPVALVGDGRQADKVASFRLYYTTRPLGGHRTLRLPIFKKTLNLTPPDVVGRYVRALAEGNLTEVLGCFEPDAGLRDPNGHVTHRGLDALESFFRQLFVFGGGIVRAPCALTDDGTCCAVEYNVIKWGRVDLPAQAGIAVYERSPGGKLSAARFYDDVDPPKMTALTKEGGRS